MATGPLQHQFHRLLPVFEVRAVEREHRSHMDLCRKAQVVSGRRFRVVGCTIEVGLYSNLDDLSHIKVYIRLGSIH